MGFTIEVQWYFGASWHSRPQRGELVPVRP